MTSIYEQAEVPLQSNEAGINKANIGWMNCAAIFSVILTVCLAFNFLSSHPKVSLLADCGHYFLSCQYVSAFLSALIQGHWQPDLLFNKTVVHALLFDGPMLPTIYAVFFVLCGHIPQNTDWPLLVIGQSIFHALSAVLVAVIVSKISSKKQTAFWAGLAYGLYPGGIAMTERFLTESPAVFFMLCLVWLVSENLNRWRNGILAGMTAVVVNLLRPAYAPAALLIAVRGAIKSKSTIKALSLLAVSALIAMSPWLIYTKLATGKMELSVPRLSTYIKAYGLGWDVESDAWQTIPATPLTKKFNESQGLLGATIYEWSHYPKECLVLLAKKTGRLYGEPENGFRHGFFFINYKYQLALHLIYLSFGLLGIFQYLVWIRKSCNSVTKCILDCSLLGVLAPLPYLLFECINRYGFMAMSFITVFAVLAGEQVIRKSRDGCREIFNQVAFISIAMLGALGLFYLANYSNATEKIVELNPDSSLQQLIDLRHAHLSLASKFALVLVDGDKTIEQARVEVNGHLVTEPLRSINYFDASKYFMLGTMRESAYAMGLSIPDFRQWRVSCVPAEWLDLHGINSIRVSLANGQSVVYADKDVTSRKMLSPAYFSTSKIFNLTGLEPRILSTFPAELEKRVSLSVVQAGQTRITNKLPVLMHIMLAIPSTESSHSAIFGSSGAESFEHIFTVKDFDPLMCIPGSDSIFINKRVMKIVKFTGCSQALPDFKESSHLMITVKARVRSLKHSGQAGILVCLQKYDGSQLILNTIPGSIKITPQWQMFEFSEMVPRAVLTGGAKVVTIALYPCPWMEAQYGADDHMADTQFQNISVAIKSSNTADFSNLSMQYY